MFLLEVGVRGGALETAPCAPRGAQASFGSVLIDRRDGGRWCARSIYPSIFR